MKIYLVIFSIVFLFIGCSENKKQNDSLNSITDDLGNTFSADSTPKKIISLAPNLTEMIYFLGLENKLVGNTLYCNYPPESQKVEKVGDMLTFNFEKILTTKPDLIFITVEGNTKETYDKFRDLGLKIFVSNPRNYEGIKKTMLDFGKIFGMEKFSEKKAVEWDSIISSIRKSAEPDSPKTAMYVVELKPLMLAGKNTFLNEFLQICGLRNIAEDSPMNYPLYSREEVLKRNPDYIIIPTDGAVEISNIENIYPEWNNLKAVSSGNIIFVDRDLYSRPGPRFIEAVIDLHRKIRRQ
jgi:iron complex transport system substrate-binding protein